MLWKSPELLRAPSSTPNGTQKGDIYAFGILLFEIILRNGPFGSSPLSPDGKPNLLYVISHTSVTWQLS